PFTVKVNEGPPRTAVVGLRVEMAGRGFGGGPADPDPLPQPDSKATTDTKAERQEREQDVARCLITIGSVSSFPVNRGPNERMVSVVREIAQALRNDTADVS